MTTYNTGNPVPSADARDRYDNSQTFDEVINGTLTYYVNRKGANVYSLKGMQQLFEIAQAQMTEQFNELLKNSGYEIPVPYAAGILIERYSQLIEKDGEFYRAAPGMIPFTTTGTWATDAVKLVAVGDASIRQELGALGYLTHAMYQTHAEFITSVVPPGAGSVQILGYLKPGDGGGHTKERITTPSVVKPWHSQSADGAWWEIRENSITLVMFGGRRTYAYNSLPALLNALDYSAEFNAKILDSGVYGLQGAVPVLTRQVSIEGIGPAARMGYQTYDDKRWLRQGTDTDGRLFKDKIPGLAFIFKNGGSVASQTLANRTDDYATVAPGFTFGANGNSLRNFAVIQDNDCFDAAGAHIPLGSENTATNFDVGIFYKDAARNESHGLTCWGYWNKAGTAIWSTDGNDDPDGNLFYGGMTAGRHGLALIGASFPSAQVGGLSGTMFYGTTFGSKDHNARVANVGGFTVADYYANADAEGWRSVFIDGDVSTNTVDLAGQFFYGCVLRTSANYPVQLGACSSIKFFGGIQESGNYGVPGSNTTKWLAATYTGAGVSIDRMRIAELGALFHPLWAGRIAFSITEGVSGNGSTIYSKPRATVPGGWSAMKVGTGRGTGDVGIQFTNDLASEGNMFNMGLDESEGSFKIWLNNVQCWAIEPTGVVTMKNYKATPGTAKEIVSDAIVVDSGFHAVNGQGGGDKNLSTITGGVSDGQILVLRRGNAIITVKHAVGNIRCGSDRVLNTSLDRITLEWDAGQRLWAMRSFAANG